MYKGGVYFQVPGKDVGPVRQQLDGGPSEFREGTPSTESAGETATEGGYRATSVRHVLSGGGPGSLTFGGGDLIFVRCNIPESVRGARGINISDNGTEGSVA